MTSPYQQQPASAFWRTGVVDAGRQVPHALYRAKWAVTKSDRIATAGSCFAQHIGRRLKARGYAVIDMEPPPATLPQHEHARFGFGIYSARYGNIYTARQLLQLVQEALGDRSPADLAWRRADGRVVDALRPGVEPDGLDGPEELAAHRAQHLARVREMLQDMDVLVFTLGLTEAWVDRNDGTVYPTAPGTLGGAFDATRHVFHNFRSAEVCADLRALRARLQEFRGRPLRLLLTVSPVPLTATATDQHVMVATLGSKAVLRAAAGELAEDFADVDYFPSYEIIANPWTGVPRYEDNLRSVRADAVDAVMDTFIAAHEGDTAGAPPPVAAPAQELPAPDAAEGDVVCEEVLLESFGRAAKP